MTNAHGMERQDRLNRLAKEALDIQDACNLSGLAQRFAAVMREICELEPSGTDARNQSPIARAWISKFVSLARLDDGADFRAFTDCGSMADQLLSAPQSVEPG